MACSFVTKTGHRNLEHSLSEVNEFRSRSMVGQGRVTNARIARPPEGCRRSRPAWPSWRFLEDLPSMSSTLLPNAPTRPLERFLRLFTDVRDGEGPQVVLLAFNVFLILTAYYVMKPVREALILTLPNGAEVKSYALAAQAVPRLVIVPLYGALARRMNRRTLINVVTLFFIACPPAFYVATGAGINVGVTYFLWLGIFSLMVIAQFWAFCNDLYTTEAGKRLFALIAFGASSGAVFGAWISGSLIEVLGVRPLMLLGSAVLALSLVLF